MKQVFIINGIRLTVSLIRINSTALLNDISTIGNIWRQSVSGDRKIEIEGVTEAGEKIEGTFRIISRSRDGIMEIEAWNDQPEFGRGD